MPKVESTGTGYREDSDQVVPRKQSVPPKSAPLYGVVQYDFQAERPDELDAKAGEAIIIIAQSNHEWFVAKPIGRLGGPGLIPVSFIEIRDMATGKPIGNLEEIAAKAAIPKVEEWKKAAAEYKNSSISLGRFDFDRQDEHELATQGNRQDSKNAGTSDYGSEAGTHYEESRSRDPLFVANASVDQFLSDGSRYWFLVRVEMNDGRHRNLCRYYEDFYDFQIALLEEFPMEAGRTGEQRILPFMPGPLTYVDDTISAQRRADLHVYVEELCTLPAHVVRSPLVQNLFSAREGDVESSHPTSMMPQPTFKAGHRARMASTSQSSNRRSDIPSDKVASGSYHPQPNRAEPSTGPARLSERYSSSNNNNSNQSIQENPRKESQASSFIKIKVFYEEDLIAIRVAHDIDYEQLCEKLKERLSGTWTTISFKDESNNTWHQVDNHRVFRDLLQKSDKIVLYVR